MNKCWLWLCHVNEIKTQTNVTSALSTATEIFAIHTQSVMPELLTVRCFASHLLLFEKQNSTVNNNEIFTVYTDTHTQGIDNETVERRNIQLNDAAYFTYMVKTTKTSTRKKLLPSRIIFNFIVLFGRNLYVQKNSWIFFSDFLGIEFFIKILPNCMIFSWLSKFFFSQSWRANSVTLVIVSKAIFITLHLFR